MDHPIIWFYIWTVVALDPSYAIVDPIIVSGIIYEMNVFLWMELI